VPPTEIVHWTVSESLVLSEIPLNTCFANIASVLVFPSVALNRPDSFTILAPAALFVNVADITTDAALAVVVVVELVQPDVPTTPNCLFRPDPVPYEVMCISKFVVC
jgi:hypothetical protein